MPRGLLGCLAYVLMPFRILLALAGGFLTLCGGVLFVAGVHADTGASYGWAFLGGIAALLISFVLRDVIAGLQIAAKEK